MATKPAILPVFIRSEFNYDTDAASDETALVCNEPTRTQQQFAEEVNINTIVERFGLTGELPENLSVPVQGDFTSVVDYQSALNLVLAADDAFMEMPAKVRERFGNDAGLFLEFVSAPENLEEARKLGIAKPVPTPPSPVLVAFADDLEASAAPPPPPKPPKKGGDSAQ